MRTTRNAGLLCVVVKLVLCYLKVVCSYMQLYAVVCSCMQLCAVVCSCVQLYAAVCSCVQLYAVFSMTGAKPSPMDFDVDLPDLTCPDLFLISVELVTFIGYN